jgi:hypothetical protein
MKDKKTKNKKRVRPVRSRRKKKDRLKPISLQPLTFDEAIGGFIRAPSVNIKSIPETKT